MSANTILSLINLSTEFLARKKVEKPRLDAELLLAHLLQLPRLQLYLQFERELDEITKKQYRELVVRRGQREPLAYIVGQVQFMGLYLQVDRRVLIPRPETELIAEWICQHLPTKPKRIIDCCTGSGCLGLALAAHFTDAEVTVADLSEEALIVAGSNARRNNLLAQILHSDLLMNATGEYDLITANPPYVSEEEYKGLTPEITAYEPYMALVAADNGLALYRRLIQETLPHTACGGFLVMELGAGQCPTVTREAEEIGWKVYTVQKDYQGFERMICLQR